MKLPAIRKVISNIIEKHNTAKNLKARNAELEKFEEKALEDARKRLEVKKQSQAPGFPMSEKTVKKFERVGVKRISR